MYLFCFDFFLTTSFSVTRTVESLYLINYLTLSLPNTSGNTDIYRVTVIKYLLSFNLPSPKKAINLELLDEKINQTRGLRLTVRLKTMLNKCYLFNRN